MTCMLLVRRRDDSIRVHCAVKERPHFAKCRQTNRPYYGL